MVETAGSVKTFRDLKVWRKAHEFVLDIYKVTETLPKTEVYGLTSQVRRAAVSVPANIAEGFKKRGQADKARFYNIAQGSLNETDYYLILIQDLGYAETGKLLSDSEEIGRMLSGLYKAVVSIEKQ
jgi:four helix bundle protein